MTSFGLRRNGRRRGCRGGGTCVAQGVCVGLGPGSPPSSATPPVPGWTLHRQSSLPSSCPRDQVVDCKQQQRSADFKPIPVVVGRRRSANLSVNYLPLQHRSTVLINCNSIKRTDDPSSRSNSNTKFPTLYVLNSASLAKKHVAVDQLAADLTGYQIDVAIITETHYKPSKHPNSIMNIDGYNLYRRPTPGWRCGHIRT